MGVRWLRYPGGNKSDNYFWASPPKFTQTLPQTALWGLWDWPSMETEQLMKTDRRFFKSPVLDFDQFMDRCREVGAEPILVVNHDSVAPSGQSPGKYQTQPLSVLLEHARSWVAYSRKRGYQVRYWEIGNETYLHDQIKTEDYARNFLEFARVMKAENPDILIGANAEYDPDIFGKGDPAGSPPYLKTLVEEAGHAIDFLSIHQYPCYRWTQGYGTYAQRLPEIHPMLDRIRQRLAEWRDPAYARTMRFALTETNSADWYGHPEQKGWKHDSNVGHGIVLFDILGQYLQRQDLDMVQV
ncbi:MAG: hypothetical protein HC904_13975 [Blastochloris sp.]|nr:hypothetical protein [Blastochloris sp.]